VATVKQTIGEIDYVAFVEAVDKVEGAGRWPAGTRGTVVRDFGDYKMVEISNDRGESLDFPVVPQEKLGLITKHSHSPQLGIGRSTDELSAADLTSEPVAEPPS
jgi:hypothetical protein